MIRISLSGVHDYSNYPFFLILKILDLYAELPQKIMPYDYDQMKIRKVNFPSCILGHTMFDIPNYIACYAYFNHH
jgi:hypothetical protein